MTKRIVSLLLVVLFGAYGLFATGSPEPESAAASGGAVAAQNISFWHIFPEGDQTFELFDGMVNSFNEAEPGIQVEHMGISFWDYWTKLTTSVAGGTGPDIAFNTAENVKMRIDAGTIVNLSQYFDRDGIDTSRYVESQLAYMSDESGTLYAFPYGSPVRVLYYDRDMFAAAGLDPEEPPRNWNELEAYAEELTTFKDGNRDLIDVIGFDPAMGNFYFWTLAWTNGGRFFDDDLNPTINTPRNLEALEWMVKMHRKYGTRAMQAFESQNASLKIDPFIAGKAAMIVHNEGLYAQVKQYAPEKNIGVAPIPYQRERASWSSGFTLEISDKGDKALADAAWEFFWKLISPEGEKAFYEKTGWIMSDKTLLNDPLVKNDPILAAILAEAPYARNRVYVKEVQAWHVVMSPAIEAALLGEKSPQEALAEAQKLVEDAIANYKETN
jgi:multiple sugar transport system substrate-binding protein